MATNIEAIVNTGLIMMGNKTLVGSLTTPTTEPAITANVIYVGVRQSLLRMFSWNFATKRRTLSDEAIATAVTAQTMALTLSDTEGYLITATAASGTPFATANLPIGKNIMEANSGTGIAYITNRTSDTVVTVDIQQNFSTTAVLASNWKVRYGPAAFGWYYRYHLNTYLTDGTLYWTRIWKVNGKDTGFEVEDGFLCSNDDIVEIKYTMDISDTTKYDPLFDEVYSWMLAYMFCLKFSADKAVFDRVAMSLTAALKRAEAVHGKEGTNRAEIKTWFDAGR